MASPKQQIDAYLGDGNYDEWIKMDARLEQENNRFDAILKLLKKSFPPVTDRAYDDFTRINEIANNYRMAMKYIMAGRVVVKDKVGKLHDLYTLALILAEDVNDTLEAFWGTGFAAAWVVFPFMLLQAKSNTMLSLVRALREELAKAEKEVKNAKHKLYIHATITFFEAIFPEISLTARAALYLTDIIVDKALGPDDTSAKQKVVGDVTPGVKQFSEAVHHIPEYGKHAHEIAEKAGKVAMLATFYFDFDEIGEGDEKVEKIKTLVEQAQRAYEDLRKVIEENSKRMDQFLIMLQNALVAIESARKTADTERNTLTADSAEYNYKGGNATAWLSVP